MHRVRRNETVLVKEVIETGSKNKVGKIIGDEGVIIWV